MIHTLRSFLLSTILIVLLRNLLIFGQVTVNRSCSSYSVPNSTFELDKFQGQWYEIAKYGQAENCTFDVVTHSYHENRSTIKHFAGPYKNQNVSTIIIEQRFNNSNNLIIIKENRTFPLKMLATDYNNYIIFWGCTDKFAATSSQTLVILSKHQHYTVHNLSEVQYHLSKVGISSDHKQLRDIDHSKSICNKNTYYNTSFHNSTHHTTHSGSGKSEHLLTSLFLTVLLSQVI